VKTAFVTGATGFIGVNLTRALLTDGWQVTCLHRAASRLDLLRELPVALCVGELADAASLERAMPPGVDTVFHVAGDTSAWSRHDQRQTATNVIGTRNLVGAAHRRGARRFVLTSTAAAWGRQHGPLSESCPSTAARSWINYERSKWLAEEEVRAGFRAGLEAVIVNPCAVFGPFDTSVWGNVFAAIRAGRLAAIPPGSITVNHVEEVVRAHIAAALHGRPGENYLLGGEHASFATLFREMAATMGVTLRAPVVPAVVFRGVARLAVLAAAIRGTEPEMTPEMADILCRDNRVQTDKAERELGYRPVPLRKCVADSHAWLKAQGRI
jgi:nucleoside-diphosphate-sugar epimerase